METWYIASKCSDGDAEKIVIRMKWCCCLEKTVISMKQCWCFENERTISIKRCCGLEKIVTTSSLLLRSCPSFTVLSSFSFIILRAWHHQYFDTGLPNPLHLSVEDSLGIWIVLQRLLKISFAKCEQVGKALRHHVCCSPLNIRLFSAKIMSGDSYHQWQHYHYWPPFTPATPRGANPNNCHHSSHQFHLFMPRKNNHHCHHQNCSCHYHHFHLLMPATPRRAISPKTEPLTRVF